MPKQIQTLQQKQSLTMTTTMHQSIAILQMSNMELAEFAAQELDKNPFIEDGNVTVDSNQNHGTKKEVSQQPATRQSYAGGYSSQDFLSNIASEKSLKEHITEQINLAFDDNKDKLIAHYLLDSLSSSGYLNVSLYETSKVLRCDEKIALGVLKKLQTFDPIGIFARNLRECLLIQLNDQENVDPSLLAMVQNIELIAEGNLKKLSKLCNVNIGNISALIKQIKLLNPKPANGFFIEPTSYKIPDIILTFTEDGLAKLETNPEAMPRLRVSEEYYLKVKGSFHTKEEKDFARTEIETANMVVKSIEQRSNTILKVATAIVQEQMDFFTRGVMYLKPMTLNKIAAITDFNESTISRSTAHKYISTPTGIFELKYFFSSSLNTTRNSGDNISSTKAKEIIKQLIMSEESDHILSDDDISEQLSKFNISIARRTVAKYREAIGIPTSSVRKRNKMIAGTY
ncbi:MAG: RNA polymerase factor sigma-54 [Rickettsiaceae bacterium]|nr:RNA polymerase factor sigma-54 [Rickettsiaceae bacterium]MDP5020853.1 RNA polymerase factor sigma-54 [Rickettsiaceae bacterium]MDP5083425.1 RNA polymerase factor sigma-54 [Rickettsiaceae bacterium]